MKKFLRCNLLFLMLIWGVFLSADLYAELPDKIIEECKDWKNWQHEYCEKKGSTEFTYFYDKTRSDDVNPETSKAPDWRSIVGMKAVGTCGNSLVLWFDEQKGFVVDYGGSETYDVECLTFYQTIFNYDQTCHGCIQVFKSPKTQ